MDGKYLYCVIKAGQPRRFTSPGMAPDTTVYTLHHGDLVAVVSDSPEVEYQRARQHLLAHTRVLEEVMQSHDILPVQFGTVAPSAQVINQRLLQQRGPELESMFAVVAQRVELSLKVMWYQQVVFDEIMAENPALARLRDSLQGRNPDETYYERIQLGQRIESALAQKRAADAALIFDTLRPLAEKTIAKDPLTDRMVANGAFLVNAGQEANFDQAVAHLDQAQGHRLKFKYVGPVPPYNFVTVRVNWNN